MRPKMALIGYGASAIGFLRGIKKYNYDVTIFEKRPLVLDRVGGLGYDGKLFLTESLADRFIYRPEISIQEEMADYLMSYLETGSSLRIGTSSDDPFDNILFNEIGLNLIKYKTYHIGTDQLSSIVEAHYNEFKQYENVTFKFGTNVRNIDRKNKNLIVYSLHQNGYLVEEHFDIVIVAVGRKGFRLVKKLLPLSPDLRREMKFADVGVRYEIPSAIMDEVNKKMYELKISFTGTNGLKVRTFCNNPSGFVVTEKFDNFTIVNGHSISNIKSSNTNIAILCSYLINDSYQHPNDFCETLAMKSNKLSGSKDKVILQAYGDFKKNKRTDHLYSVFPTLSPDAYSKGNLRKVLPHDLSITIIEFIETINTIIPNFNFDGNLIYGVEAKFYGDLVNNDAYPNLKFIGDCSGYTGNLITAALMGYEMAKSISQSAN